eukprot:766926-Hanusia_phi.AAC.3
MAGYDCVRRDGAGTLSRGLLPPLSPLPSSFLNSPPLTSTPNPNPVLFLLFLPSLSSPCLFCPYQR